MALPTYKEANSMAEITSEEKFAIILRLIAPHLDKHNLAVLSRVSKLWEEVLGSHLWANPGKFLEQTSERGFDWFSITTFLREAQISRESTRARILTLDFSSLLRSADEYHRLDIDELVASFMNICPALKFVIFDESTYFQHGGLGHASKHSALKILSSDAFGHMPASAHTTRGPDGNIVVTPPELTVLSMARCPRYDFSSDLDMPYLKNLWYLDISYTATDDSWFSRFKLIIFPNLRVLKLKGLRITDTHMLILLANGLGKIWSLDLADNLLSDFILLPLLGARPHPPLPTRPEPEHPGDFRLYLEDSPRYSKEDRGREHRIIPLRPDSATTFIRYIEDHGHPVPSEGPILEERDPVTISKSLTHLYLSDNRFRDTGIRRLLEAYKRLQVLDVGSVRAGCVIPVFAQFNSVKPLSATSGTRLQRLRIHHSVVTYAPTEINELPIRISPLVSEDMGKKESNNGWEAFNPNDNHRITHLTLTGLHPYSHGFVLERLKEFLSKCAAQEAHINEIKTSLGRQTRHSPPVLPGLRYLGLEFDTAVDHKSTIGSSVSGDRDADLFMVESLGDFSFFDSFSSSRSRQAEPGPSSPTPPALLDVVEELRKFRASMEVKWSGMIEVFRK